MISVLLFGPVAERAGVSSLQVQYRADLNLLQLRDELAAKYPQAFELVCFIAVSGEHVRDLQQLVSDGSEIVFMSKFSGG